MSRQIDIKSIAPLRNMVLFNGLLDRVLGRGPNLPGMATFYGPSGYGKTFSAVWGAARANARYVRLGETTTRKTMCQDIVRELGISGLPGGQLTDLVDAIVDALAETNSPLIIDEADFLVKKGLVDLARELHDRSGAPVILIGEELLPAKLGKFERTHNRMLDWVAAIPCDLRDAQQLARVYCAGVDVDDDLIGAIAKASEGRARRIGVNLHRVREKAKVMGKSRMTLADWGDEAWFTGEPPKRRVA